MVADGKPSPLMFRIFNLLDAIRRLSPFSNLTADEEQLLFRLILRWENAVPFTVGDIMKEDTSASPSSTYRRLTCLCEKGLAELITDPDDRRIKFVRPTMLSEEFVREFNAGLTQALRGDMPV